MKIRTALLCTCTALIVGNLWFIANRNYEAAYVVMCLAYWLRVLADYSDRQKKGGS
jgi:hypothetical protein